MPTFVVKDDLPAADEEEREPISFQIPGITNPAPKPKEGEDQAPPVPVTFVCEIDWPAGAVLDIAKAVQGVTEDEELTPEQAMDQFRLLGTFFDMVLTADSAKEFEAHMHTKKPPITLRKALLAFQQCLSAYMSPRPTGGPSDSSDGSEPSGNGSTAAAPLPDWIR